MTTNAKIEDSASVEIIVFNGAVQVNLEIGQ